ncbi:MAG TPA: hypothetical protein VMB21_06820, partial [Candidatus Limnocylindria bacterium]|nr:hypothetical protein [Candidatus Limnocylindria bacterium]
MPCHRLRGQGNEVGPDLALMATKPVDWLLTAILDFSQAVVTRYPSWTLHLRCDEELAGLITTGTASNLVLGLPDSSDLPVLRSDLQSVEPQTLSLMP